MLPFLRLLPLASLLLGACAERTSPDAAFPDSVEAQAVSLPGTVPYALSAPEHRWRLPARLREISGLTVLPSGNLLAIQDEDGDIFEIDGASGVVLGHKRFYSSGDYEGVEQVGDVTWVVESDGDLYRFTGTGEAERIETSLSRNNDVEGLGLSADGKHLLLALKGDSAGGLKGVRTVLAYDPARGVLLSKPAFTLERETLDEGGAPFKPSGIAVHPASGEVYVISSVRKALVVLTPEGALHAAVSLPSRLYPQPEGIAFAPDGTLYISNEGGGGSATLLRFPPQPLP